MTLEVFTIEIKVDAEENGHEAVLEVVKNHARALMAAAMMVSKPGRTPQIMVRTEDRFYDQQEIDIFKDLEG